MTKTKFYLLIILGGCVFWLLFFLIWDYASGKQARIDEANQARFECRIAKNGDNCNF